MNDLRPERAQSVADEIRSAGGRALAVPFDVTSLSDAAAGISAAAGQLGEIDILVNNAGVPDGMALKPFREMSPDEWSRFVDLNLYGVLHCTRAVIDSMCDRGYGRVITISSGAGQVGLAIGVSLYGAGKGGAISFLRHLALEVAPAGVTVNILALGLMGNAGDSDTTRALSAAVPVGRLGTPQDVGSAVVHLASRESGWMTGQTIGLNGGSVTS